MKKRMIYVAVCLFIALFLLVKLMTGQVPEVGSIGAEQAVSHDFTEKSGGLSMLEMEVSPAIRPYEAVFLNGSVYYLGESEGSHHLIRLPLAGGETQGIESLPKDNGSWYDLQSAGGSLIWTQQNLSSSDLLHERRQYLLTADSIALPDSLKYREGGLMSWNNLYCWYGGVWVNAELYVWDGSKESSWTAAEDVFHPHENGSIEGGMIGYISGKADGILRVDLETERTVDKLQLRNLRLDGTYCSRDYAVCWDFEGCIYVYGYETGELWYLETVLNLMEETKFYLRQDCVWLIGTDFIRVYNLKEHAVMEAELPEEYRAGGTLSPDGVYTACGESGGSILVVSIRG